MTSADEIEVIKHAAVKCYQGLIMLGKSHADCIHKAMHIGVEINQRADAQGFFTNKGRFVTRKEGAEIAMKSFMVHKKIEVLFSEDLWSSSSGGIWSYDYVKGYEL